MLINSNNFTSLVLFEDNHLLVVIKPAGLLVQGDATGRPCLLDLAKDYLKVKYSKPGRVFVGLVHRLDRQVAGVMVLARTSKAAARLSAQFREHRNQKIYWAVIHGRLTPARGLSEMYLVRQGRLSAPGSARDPEARLARLKYKTIETAPRSSLVEIDLLTGRRHQIRAQLSALGNPIVGDALYGSRISARHDAIGLFARSLALMHPTTGLDLLFEATPEPDWPWLPLKE